MEKKISVLAAETVNFPHHIPPKPVNGWAAHLCRNQPIDHIPTSEKWQNRTEPGFGGKEMAQQPFPLPKHNRDLHS